ncbi:hypothetical protein SBV42_00390 [Chlamydia crocodili]|uniref:Uncharacterized protein n=1 Tax=Chlamydia crocodili TaxID=2766982 RepID=A0ABX8CDZ8_9CHLA|nr:hypothetical protein [Chlamydia crocodili]QVE49228.1 hypothetical protein H9Q19_00760 [Chlamydia crocodili]
MIREGNVGKNIAAVMQAAIPKQAMIVAIEAPILTHRCWGGGGKRF